MKLAVRMAAAVVVGASALPLIGKGRSAYKAYKTLRAIDIRTVNTVAADARRTEGVDAPAATSGRG